MSKGNTVTVPRTYRATPEMGAAIARAAAAAAAAGVSEASWVREIVHKAIPEEISEEDVERIKRPRRSRSRPVPTVEVAAIAGLREVVGEAVGTLRQVAGVDRKRSGARLGEIDAALDQLISAAAFLDQNKVRLISEPVQDSE